MFAASWADAAEYVDRIRFGRNSAAGQIVRTTPDQVTLDQGGGGTRDIPVNEIRRVLFEGEPSQLTQARLQARNGQFAAALEMLNEINLADIDRDLVRQEVEFYRALCAAKLALGGRGEIVAAGGQLHEFVQKHPKNFHHYEAIELMGDLLRASGRYGPAEQQYARLAQAPWPDYQMRARVLAGQTLQAQGNHEEAIRRFDAVLAMPQDDELAQQQQLAATLGKAVSLAEIGQVDEAVRMIEGVIRDADPERQELQARAYNALGACYEKAGKAKDALLAYLHVDLLYSSVPEEHAEALSRLVPLWRQVGQEARARDAQQRFDEQYAGSR